jgi:hypothetical protein
LPKFLIPLDERLDVLPLRFTQIGHNFYLQPILAIRKCLLAGYIGEMGSRCEASIMASRFNIRVTAQIAR